MSAEWDDVKRELRWHKWLLIAPLAIMWALQLVNTLTMGSLVGLGIHPRTAVGLVGILLAPLLHCGIFHLVGNSISWLLFGWLIIAGSVREYAIVLAATWLGSGLGTWALGANPSVHVGASGVIFGFFGYLLMRGWFRRTFGSVMLSLLLGIAYGGMIFGVLPGQCGISWEGHLCGFVAGALTAWALRKRMPATVATRAR